MLCRSSMRASSVRRRTLSATASSSGQQVQGPAHMVHGDYTLTSAPQRLRDLAQPPGANDTLRRDEALLIKQRDTAGPLASSGGAKSDGDDSQAACTFSFHSAFEDPMTPADAPERWSIEVRCVALYD